MFRPQTYYQAFQRINNRCCDLRLGISTGGIEEAKAQRDDSCYYVTINYSIIQKILSRLQLGPEDTFVDIGSGKGRILCCAARYPCKIVIGVEYSEEFCDSARANSRRLRGLKTPIVVHNGLAEDFDYSDATVLFFFNPFGHVTLDLVLRRIQEDTYDQDIRLAFVNPSVAQDEVFAGHTWLKPYDRWEMWGQPSVAFYRRNNAY